jgi:hypothetical protein
VRLPGGATDHRRFWDALDRLSAQDLAVIETRIGQAIIAEYGIDTSALVLDMTNFATFIDSGNDKAPIAQRGKAKQKRTDLRLVGLGLVVTHDGGIPLLSHAYPGDRPDVTQFPTLITELLSRYQAAHADPRLDHPGLRRRAELGRQPSADRGVRDRVRRIAAAQRPPRPTGHQQTPLPHGGR